MRNLTSIIEAGSKSIVVSKINYSKLFHSKELLVAQPLLKEVELIISDTHDSREIWLTRYAIMDEIIWNYLRL